MLFGFSEWVVKRINVLSACRLRRLARRQDGAVTVEAVLWVPFFVILFIILTDVSIIFFNQSRIVRVLQDANRNMSIGRFDTVQQTQDFIVNTLNALSFSAEATTSITAGLISSTVTVPVGDLDVFGLIGSFAGISVTVSAQHLSEI